MQRLRAAAGPVAFFTGLTLFCGALVEFQRWPYVIRRFNNSDFELVVQPWRPELGELVQSALALSSEPRLLLPVTFVLVNASALALIGLVVAMGGRKLAGASLAGVGALTGALILTLAALSFEPPVCDHLMTAIEVFGAVLGFVMVGALFVEPRAPFAVRAETLAAAGLATALLAVTVWFAASAEGGVVCDRWSNQGLVPPTRPFLPLLALFGTGILGALLRPRVVRPNASLCVLAAGILTTLPALAIAHDERIEIHAATVSDSSELTTVQTVNCPPVQLAPVIQVTRSEVIISGAVMGTTGQGESIEEAVFQKLDEMRRQVDDLRAQGEHRGPWTHQVNLQADVTTPLATLAGISRASLRSGFRDFAIVSVQDWAGFAWTRPVAHRHVCALPIEFESDGHRLSDFADWPALVRAADLAGGKLRIRVESRP